MSEWSLFIATISNISAISWRECGRLNAVIDSSDNVYPRTDSTIKKNSTERVGLVQSGHHRMYNVTCSRWNIANCGYKQWPFTHSLILRDYSIVTQEIQTSHSRMCSNIYLQHIKRARLTFIFLRILNMKCLLNAHFCILCFSCVLFIVFCFVWFL